MGFSLPPVRTLLVGLVGGAVLGVGLYFAGVRAGARETALTYDLKLAQQATTHIQQQSVVTAQNTILQDRLAHLAEEQTYAQVQSDRVVGDLLRSLQARSARPPAAPDTGSSSLPSGGPRYATGAELYREDSEFLVREAARADQIRLALHTCTQQYRAVEAAVAASARAVQPPVNTP